MALGLRVAKMLRMCINSSVVSGSFFKRLAVALTALLAVCAICVLSTGPAFCYFVRSDRFGGSIMRPLVNQIYTPIFQFACSSEKFHGSLLRHYLNTFPSGYH